MKSTIIPLVALAPLVVILPSCENPADTTTDAEVQSSQSVATASATAQTYRFTQTSVIGFTGSKVTESHSGGFKTFSGGFTVNNGVPESGSFTIDMTSIWSDDERLTGHLKNEDFFNVPKFPESKFEVTKFQQDSATTYTVSGNLTMVGVTKNITFPTTVTQSADTVTLQSSFDINRKDWGIIYAGMADNLIRDEVVITLNLTAEAEK